jgi:hypothetical protein
MNCTYTAMAKDVTGIPTLEKYNKLQTARETFTIPNAREAEINTELDRPRADQLVDMEGVSCIINHTGIGRDKTIHTMNPNT